MPKNKDYISKEEARRILGSLSLNYFYTIMRKYNGLQGVATVRSEKVDGKSKYLRGDIEDVLEWIKENPRSRVNNPPEEKEARRAEAKKIKNEKDRVRNKAKRDKERQDGLVSELGVNLAYFKPLLPYFEGEYSNEVLKRDYKKDIKSNFKECLELLDKLKNVEPYGGLYNNFTNFKSRNLFGEQELAFYQFLKDLIKRFEEMMVRKEAEAKMDEGWQALLPLALVFKQALQEDEEKNEKYEENVQSSVGGWFDYFYGVRHINDIKAFVKETKMRYRSNDAKLNHLNLEQIEDEKNYAKKRLDMALEFNKTLPASKRFDEKELKKNVTILKARFDQLARKKQKTLLIKTKRGSSC